jgi:hypothetical protein
MLIGYYISGKVVDAYTNADATHHWQNVWLVPAGIAAVVMLLFGVLFKNGNMKKAE